MNVTKNIFDMDKVEILEKLLEMKVDPNDIHDVRDICRLSNVFLCNLLDHVYIDYNYLKCKLKFNDDELGCSTYDLLQEQYFFMFVPRIWVCKCVLTVFLLITNELQYEYHFGRAIQY